MIDVNVKGIVKEITWKSNKSCKFIIQNEDKELLCTITKRRLILADNLEIGKEYNFMGRIAAFRKKTGRQNVIENTFYVTGLLGTV